MSHRRKELLHTVSNGPDAGTRRVARNHYTSTIVPPNDMGYANSTMRAFWACRRFSAWSKMALLGVRETS